MKRIMTRYILTIILTVLGLGCFAQAPMEEIIFLPSDEDFINPERGFVSNMYSDEVRLDKKTLDRLKANRESMVWRQFNLDPFKDCDIPDKFLSSVKKDSIAFFLISSFCSSASCFS